VNLLLSAHTIIVIVSDRNDSYVIKADEVKFSTRYRTAATCVTAMCHK